ncbi:MAG: HTH domain-containing protein [Nocardioidaceae bacterium]|nr:HTH domain-containing protein [Nocardioidaceae bacterium]
MRASRLLLMLLLLQNRGKMTAAELARELEVTRRTVLRDVDALGEAGLPVVVTQGRHGGIELGFSYRTRLTGLAADEAEALGVLLGRAAPELDDLGLGEAGKRARTKLLESLPDGVRRTAQDASTRFLVEVTMPDDDDRVPALADAVRGGRIVRVRSTDAEPRTVHPVGLLLRDGAWWLLDGLDPHRPIALADCGTVNISRRTFATAADL